MSQCSLFTTYIFSLLFSVKKQWCPTKLILRTFFLPFFKGNINSVLGKSIYFYSHELFVEANTKYKTKSPSIRILHGKSKKKTSWILLNWSWNCTCFAIIMCIKIVWRNRKDHKWNEWVWTLRGKKEHNKEIKNQIRTSEIQDYFYKTVSLPASFFANSLLT